MGRGPPESQVICCLDTMQMWASAYNRQDVRWCAATPTAGCTSSGMPRLLPPFPACRVVGTEPSAGQPRSSAALFLPHCAQAQSEGSVRGPSPRRPVASSLPQAAEFNPRTTLPRGDGKHLASCSGYKASVLLETLKTSQSWAKPPQWCLIVLFLQTEYEYVYFGLFLLW